MSFEEIRRALAAQDEQLGAAYAAVESGKPVRVDVSTLHALAELCSPASVSRGTGAGSEWNAVRG
jgi:hypothetical protein